MFLKNKRIAILLENMYQELEVWYPYYRFIEEGAKVDLVAPVKGETYHGKSGYPAKSQVGIKTTKAANYDAVIIPGGFAPDYMRRVPAMVKFVRDMHRMDKIVAAICHGGWMLVSADILKGRSATSYFAIKDDMVNAGATFLDREVVHDDGIITSRKPDDLPAFCRTIIEALD